MPCFNFDQRNQAIGRLSAGDSKRHVARLMNCNRSTTHEPWNRYKLQGFVRDRLRTGRPGVTTANQDRNVRLSEARGRFLMATETARHTLDTQNRDINDRTVR